MASTLGGELADQIGLGSVEAAQELEEGAQDLAGELLGNRVLGEAAGMEQSRQTPLRPVGEEAAPVEQQLEAAQDWPAGDSGHRADREGLPAGGLAARRADEADLRLQVAGPRLPQGDQ
ncbi:MAG TPA: hypothetical protein VGH03_04565 [Caulobacteraceae bacterium]